ncbi:MAG: DUF3800 domain-containing protein [Rhodobacteraceae bacterium]|nr:DUF3800 domain-containing protein [Paracoccaceae bacterium]
MTDYTPSYSYILYIDEAGDDGLARIKPIDKNGASEWLVIGGVLVREKYQADVVGWVKDLRISIDATQGPALHYRNLSPSKKDAACDEVSRLPIRAFAVCSNKLNMLKYQNNRAEVAGAKQWFYNYCVRLLMERVTDLCLRNSMRNGGKPESLKVIFSQRGGHSYGQTMAYWEKLKAQASGGTTLLNKREIRQQVLKFNLVDYVPHTQNAGLQLADIIASSFFQAVNTNEGRWETRHAQRLKKVMATENGEVADYGLVLQPTDVRKFRPDEEQKKIFEFYGYSL